MYNFQEPTYTTKLPNMTLLIPVGSNTQAKSFTSNQAKKSAKKQKPYDPSEVEPIDSSDPNNAASHEKTIVALTSEVEQYKVSSAKDSLKQRELQTEIQDKEATIQSHADRIEMLEKRLKEKTDEFEIFKVVIEKVVEKERAEHEEELDRVRVQLKQLEETAKAETTKYTDELLKRQPITELTDSEVMLRDTVAKFSQERMKPLVKKMDHEGQLDKGLLGELFENGLMGIEIDEQYGGTGLNFMSAIIIIEELAKIDPAISVIVDVQNTLINNCIKRYGTEAQRNKYLPRLATDMVGSFCLSETVSGSDAFALKTRAEKQGDMYVINGGKAWITNAKEAGVYIVMANVDPSAGYRGITAFLVDRDTPGLEIGKKEDKLGIRASSTCEVIFNDVKVPASAILGQLGKGYKMAIEGLNEGRIGIAAQMIGLAEGAFESTMPYLMQRKQFGKAIGEFQGMQFTYADLAVDIEAGKLLTYNAARLQEAGLPFVTEASMAKLYCSRVAEKVSSACITMLGGVGITKEFDAEKFFRDCKVGQIYEGTTNIQLQTIAKSIAAKYK
eukprot:gene2272-2575_t